jgi:hypothetical protein
MIHKCIFIFYLFILSFIKQQNIQCQINSIQIVFKKRYLWLQNNYIDFVMERNKTLGEFIIENQNAFQYSSGELPNY